MASIKRDEDDCCPDCGAKLFVWEDEAYCIKCGWDSSDEEPPPLGISVRETIKTRDRMGR